MFFRGAVLLITILTLFSVPALAAEDSDDQVMRLARVVDTREIERLLEGLQVEGDEFLPELSVETVLDLIRGRGELSLRELLVGLARYLIRDILSHARLLGQLVVLTVVGAVLWNLQSAFAGDSVGLLAHGVVYLLLVALAVGSFTYAVKLATGVVADLVSFMLALLPVLLTLLAAMGGVASAGLFHPMMVIVIDLVSVLVVDVVIPVLFLAVVLELVTGFSPNFQVSKLAVLLRQGAIVVLGLSLSLFLGIMTVLGAAGAVADGVTLRTAKFVAATFVPVVGKMFADAADVVFGSSLVLKNALGVLGALGIMVVVAFPLLKILSLVVIYRLAAAVVQPIASGQVVGCLTSLGDYLLLLFVAVLTVALMFFVGMAVIVGAGNVMVMLR